ncbi:MAG: PIN domain-containing protein [Pyrinomonadaceae bacterium]|nr:PIN domain-containing protein [Pyrinomonadaceae bacterium]
MSQFIPAAEYVADTVALVVYLEKRRLGTDSQAIFDSAENLNTIIYLPAIIFAEILYLSEKGRISTNLRDVKKLLQTNPNFRESPLTQSIIETAAQITDIPELHDRLIFATARHLNLELITTDANIQNSAFVKTVW